jgi:hypothetical protein
VVTNPAQTISEALFDHPLHALALYEQRVISPDGETLKRRFQETMTLIAAARNIGDDQARRHLPELYYAARREERRRLIAATIDRLFELADDRPTLHRIGRSLPALVHEGALHQQFCCKLATRLGLRAPLPEPVHSEIVLPLIEALIVVLRVGAPTTRDAAVEGLGALLKLAGGDADEHFPLHEPVPIKREKREKPADHDARVAISTRYCDRLERRRLLALTIGGDDEARKEFDWRLSEDIAGQLQRLRRTKSPSKLEDALYERQDLLRFLPGIARQSGDPMLGLRTTQLLRSAARLRNADERPEMIIAFARFQESVFRTIDAAMRRDRNWGDFDEDVATAVTVIPRNMTGGAPECNAQVRATIAILRTAIRLVSLAGPSSKTGNAILPLFEGLRGCSRWSNPGITEGCFRGLSQLIAHPEHDSLTGPGLEALFAEMADLRPSDDLLKMHRRLMANSAFRRLLISLTDTLQERQLFESETEAVLDKEQVDRRVRSILHHPSAERMRAVCRERDAAMPPEAPERFDLAESVIDGIAFETAMLRRGAAMLQQWDALPAVEQLLLTRILAALLRAISRDAPELARHDVLRAVFLESRGISMPNREATDLAWKLLSSIPAKAAETADLEIQRFTEYRGRQSRGDGKGDDLPGYVLAMISPAASSRIAGAIAREMDLNRRRERGQPHADFAKSLYQVTLRGPHESIFDHLLPRIAEDNDRALVLLFRKHVAKVLHSELKLENIRAHIREILPDLEGKDSETLRDLAEALGLYRRLTSDADDVWQLLKDESLMKLFEILDRLAKAPDEGQRKTLMSRHERPLRDLQYEVTHYLSVPIGNFAARKQPLTMAMDIAADLAEALKVHEGLQPPERTLLVALMLHFKDLFQRTIRWYCELPVQQIDEESKDIDAIRRFWLYFCEPPSREELETTARRRSSKADTADRLRRIALLEQRIGKRPPEFRRQRARFEEYFVHWRAGDLDVSSLKSIVGPRWPPPFRRFYELVTNFKLTSGLMAIPCLIAIVLHLAGVKRWEGAGFFVLSFAMIVAAILSFTSLLHSVASRFGRRGAPEKPGYWFESLLPRMARLTAVPMALIVEFDHSYEFPLLGSTWVLLFLMVLSLLTTRFFVTREIVDRKEKPGVFRLTPTEKRSVNQVVALALAHSFGIAVLLAAIFASSFEPPKEIHPSDTRPPAGFLQRTAWLFEHFDEPPPGRRYPTFLWVLPREVELDFGKMSMGHWMLRPGIADHARFRFYPTVILTWTALGLFFGVFLEGFMKGEHLRGGTPGETGAES